MNESRKWNIAMIIIMILGVSFITGLYLYDQVIRDPYDIEISTNDPDLISSFRLNGKQYPSSDFPFNITFNQKSIDCWIDMRYKVFNSGAYVVVVADRVFFNYQSMIDNGGVVKLIYQGLYILITLLPEGT